MVSTRRVEVALARDPLEHGLHRERGRIERRVHLLPAQRRRHRGAGLRPHRVDGGDRLALAVLVRVDQHAAALRLRPLRGREPGDAPARSRRPRSPRTCACPRRCAAARSARARGSPPSRSSSGRTRARAASSASLTSSATSIVSAKPTSGEGSRSKSTQSGRVGLSTREYHVFRSMQPMFTTQSSASSSFTSAKSTSLRGARRVARRDLEAARRDPLGHVRRARPSGRRTCRTRRRDSASS